MKHLLSIALLTTTKFTTSKAVDVANEVKSILNDTIASLAGGGSSKVEATEDGFMHIFTALSTAASLSVFFFKHLIGFTVRTAMYVLSPLLWLSSTCWNQFVTRPLDLFLHVLHVLYPAIMFCMAAICCGIFIGSCAGFAAEAFSSVLISATWGPQAGTGTGTGTGTDTDTGKAIEREDNVELAAGLADENEESDSEQEDDRRPNFFGSSSSRDKKGKEPLIPRVESWRDSLSTSSTSSLPVLIRRMEPSSTDRKNSWEWDEEDTEEEVELKSFKK